MIFFFTIVAVKQPKPAAAPIVKKKINLDSDDDDFSDPVVSPRAQSGRARQTIRYDLSDDSESDFDEDSD